MTSSVPVLTLVAVVDRAMRHQVATRSVDADPVELSKRLREQERVDRQLRALFDKARVERVLR